MPLLALLSVFKIPNLHPVNQANKIWDVIIVGAGAAGLMAAGSAASRGKQVLLLEKNKKLGVKILMSGGTRCNVTHNCSVRDIALAFGRNGRFLHSPLAALGPTEILGMLREEGVETKVESTGKIFPISNRAIDVRDALVRIAKRSGATIRNETSVVNCKVDANDQGRFKVETENESLDCRALLITSGGRSYPGCGTTGDGYGWAQRFGHSVSLLAPALTPIVSQVPWANGLKGISLENTVTRIADESGRSKMENDQPILFTHFGFSGPAPMNVSRLIGLNPNDKFKINLDLFPSENQEQLFDRFAVNCRSPDFSVLEQLLNPEWPNRFREALLSSLDFDPRNRTAETSKQNLRRLATSLKQVTFPVHGTRGYGKAEVTAGGVKLSEVDSKTMESKLVPGLYFAGEILDLDGPIGGFNFQSAFSTGWLAGQNV